MEIACVVEGDGEKQALPVLVRRIIAEIDPALSVRIYTAIAWPKSRLIKREYLARAINVAVQSFRSSGAILVLVDADDHCPAELGPRMLGWAQAARSDVPISVVIANREYEAWFLAAAELLTHLRGFASETRSPPDSESVRDAKGWLKERMLLDERYNPTSHQASFSQKMDLEQARRAPSFEKLCRDVGWLVAAMQAAAS